jgi:hypothetical protein
MEKKNNIIDLRKRLIKNIDKHIHKELQDLIVPKRSIERKAILLGDRKEMTKEYVFWFADNALNNEIYLYGESKVFSALNKNLLCRESELEHAMGMLLLSSNLGHYYFEDLVGPEYADFSTDFWTCYGDFQIRSCSFLDSVGIFLAFSFFGILNSPLYFDQVIDAIKTRYDSSNSIIDNETFSLKAREGWKVLIDARKRYKKIRLWRDDIVHNISPIMNIPDSGEEKDTKQGLLRFPNLNAEICLKESKETYFLLSLVPIAASDISFDYFKSPSFNRKYWKQE